MPQAESAAVSVDIPDGSEVAIHWPVPLVIGDVIDSVRLKLVATAHTMDAGLITCSLYLNNTKPASLAAAKNGLLVLGPVTLSLTPYAATVATTFVGLIETTLPIGYKPEQHERFVSIVFDRSEDAAAYGHALLDVFRPTLRRED